MTSGGANHMRFTPERQAKYLKVLEETGEKVMARHEVGVNDRVVAKYRKTDPEFCEAEEEAMRLYRARHIVGEIHRRAIKGIRKPIFNGGVLVGYERIYSDSLLKFHAERHIPEYRSKVTVEQPARPNFSLEELAAQLSPESQVDLRRIMEREAALREERDRAEDGQEG